MSAKIVENQYKQIVSVSATYFIDCVRELNRYVNDNQTISDAQLPLLIAEFFQQSLAAWFWIVALEIPLGDLRYRTAYDVTPCITRFYNIIYPIREVISGNQLFSKEAKWKSRGPRSCGCPLFKENYFHFSHVAL